MSFATNSVHKSESTSSNLPAINQSPENIKSEHSETTAQTSTEPEVKVELSANSAQTMTWKNRGDYHLGRKEIDLAIDAYTKALQQAEESSQPLGIAESLKSLGRCFMEREQWHFAAKMLNGAISLYQKAHD